MLHLIICHNKLDALIFLSLRSKKFRFDPTALVRKQKVYFPAVSKINHAKQIVFAFQKMNGTHARVGA